MIKSTMSDLSNSIDKTLKKRSSLRNSLTKDECEIIRRASLSDSKGPVLVKQKSLRDSQNYTNILDRKKSDSEIETDISIKGKLDGLGISLSSPTSPRYNDNSDNSTSVSTSSSITNSPRSIISPRSLKKSRGLWNSNTDNNKLNRSRSGSFGLRRSSVEELIPEGRNLAIRKSTFEKIISEDNLLTVTKNIRDEECLIIDDENGNKICLIRNASCNVNNITVEMLLTFVRNPGTSRQNACIQHLYDDGDIYLSLIHI